MVNNLKIITMAVILLMILCSIFYDIATTKKVEFKDRKELIKTYHQRIGVITENRPYISKDEFSRQAGITYVEYLYEDSENQLLIKTKNTLNALKWEYTGSSDEDGTMIDHYCKNGDGIDLSSPIKNKFHIKMYWNNNGMCR